MYRRGCLFLFLFGSLNAHAQSLSLRDQLDRPYVALFDVSGARYSAQEIKSLKSAIEQERSQQLDTCHKDEKDVRSRLDTARAGLKALNAAAPRDTRIMAAARLNLHTEITALEKNLHDKRRECDHTIPAAFEVRLAKVDLLEQWPDQNAHTIQMIEKGRARERKHGDVEDIGYRKLTDDQDKDIEVGQQALRQINAGGMLPAEIRDASVQQYVQDLGTKIARNSDLKVPLHVSVVDTQDVNAIALPGGFLFLTSGLLVACETEAELAGIVSQQIAHIAARHATRASKRSLISKMFVPAAQVATGIFTGGVSNVGAVYGMDYGFQGLGILTEKTLAASGGKAPKEADQLGIQYAWKAGFDPKGFIAFLDSLAKQNDPRGERFLLTKPPLGERLLDAFTEVTYLPLREDATVDTTEFRLAKERLQNTFARP